jgi:hypothetical protein
LLVGKRGILASVIGREISVGKIAEVIPEEDIVRRRILEEDT